MKETTPQELKKMMDDQADFVLVDVREPYEYEEMNLGGKLIPLSEVLSRKNEIPRDKKVVVHCRSGQRSATAVKALEKEGYDNLYNLKGGIMAWIDEIDPDLGG